jgi:hypothetical protein
MITLFHTKCHPTSSIRASCCHDVTNKLAFAISIRDTTIDYDLERFVNCVCYLVVCLPCFLSYLFHGDIILTKQEERDWLK